MRGWICFIERSMLGMWRVKFVFDILMGCKMWE